jgi:hypothetical protein
VKTCFIAAILSKPVFTGPSRDLLQFYKAVLFD